MEPAIERDRERRGTPWRGLLQAHPRWVVLASAVVGASLALGLSLRSGEHMRPNVRPADVAIEAASGNYGHAAALAHGRLNAALWGETPLSDQDADDLARVMGELATTFAPASHWDNVARDAAKALRAGNRARAHTLLSELDWTING